ncbi:MAG: UbiA family prenyltransferase [Salinisphaera sp.]|jgi:4-hydroxybenzoate polyprenyltransferase/phosphoserine phosphatase|nr:UbiA family prenyltransferase [Salinisphaera sp.]
MPGQATLPPLAVDLDNTLVNSDLLVESAFVLARTRPQSLLKIPGWLRAGKSRLKAEIAHRADIGIADLPYNQPLIEFLEKQKATGRELILATSSNERYAHQVADHLHLFDTVLASTADVNLSGQAKLDAIQAHLGNDKPFDYAADHDEDRVIWRAARKAILVNASRATDGRVSHEADVEHRFTREQGGWRTWVRAMRVYQWAKNALIFVPILASHELMNVSTLVSAVLAFLAFSLLASSVYLLNDLIDVGDDRQHPNKCRRPFASGKLPVIQGVLAIPLLILAAVVIALFLPPLFWAVLLAYYLATLAYSIGLKQLALLDVLTLAGLYTLRIIAGGAATGIHLSFWLLALSMSMFLSLAMAKRCTELLLVANQDKQAPRGRGYVASDLAPLQSMGSAAGYASVVILALYINSPDITEHYSHPARIWLLCPVVLYWISRIWLKTLRGEMSDDPIVFAARDTGSRLCMIVGAVIMFMAV